MTTEIKFTDTQRQILERAAQTADGRVDWFPDTIKGGARKKVLDSLHNRALITPSGENWFLTADCYDALGLPRPKPASIPDPELNAAVAYAESTWSAATPTVRPRENSKQAQVIAMLKRSEGATINQICEATGWQPHTVRGAFAGALKKKLGLTIVSAKSDGGERVYRIA